MTGANIGFVINADINTKDKEMRNHIQNLFLILIIAFAFYYKNYEYKTITDIQYFAIDDKAELLSLLDLIEDVLVNKKQYDIKLTNGTQMKLSKVMGTCYIFTMKGYTYFDKKNLSKMREFLNR